MLQFAGQDLTDYFPPPMVAACPGLVTNNQLALKRANFTPIVDYAVHTSGALQTIPNTKLDDSDWYYGRLLPDLQQYYKGSYVYTKGYIEDYAANSGK
jgi:chitin synthase